MRIYLTGFMGCGKTTLGKVVAQKTGMPFLDLDEAIEQAAGMPVSKVFERWGESHFRKLETRQLQQTTAYKSAIIATGGGCFCTPVNNWFMLENGLVIYLKATPELLYQRLSGTRQNRPLLSGKSGEALLHYIQEELHRREVWYNQATHTIDVENNPVEQLMETILPYCR